MNKFTEEELLSIIDRYGYELVTDHGIMRGVKKNSSMITPERTPRFGNNSYYWQLKRIAAYIMEKELD